MPQSGGRILRIPQCCNARLSRHLAAARRIGKRLDRDADHLVLLALDLAQVDVLDRVVRLRQRNEPRGLSIFAVSMALTRSARFDRSPFTALTPAMSSCAAS